MRRRRQSVAGALCALAGFLTISAPSALAADHSSGDRYEQRRYDPAYAGTIIIDGCAFDLSSRRSVGGQLVAEFQRRGYRAWCKGTKVFVRRGSRWPKVQWRSGSYRVSIRYAGDCVVLCPSSSRVWRGPYDGGRAKRTGYGGGSYGGYSKDYRGNDSGRYDRRKGGSIMPYPPRYSRNTCTTRSGWSSSYPYRSSRTYATWSWSTRSCDDRSSRSRRGYGRH